MEKKKNILIDTNVFVDYLRNFAPSIEFFKSIVDEENIFFSAISETELVAGSANEDPEKKKILMAFLANLRKVPVDNPLVEYAGDISRKYSLDVPDAIIAASALYKNAKLITKNSKDFENISGLEVEEPY